MKSFDFRGKGKNLTPKTQKPQAPNLKFYSTHTNRLASIAVREYVAPHQRAPRETLMSGNHSQPSSTTIHPLHIIRPQPPGQRVPLTLREDVPAHRERPGKLEFQVAWYSRFHRSRQALLTTSVSRWTSFVTRFRFRRTSTKICIVVPSSSHPSSSLLILSVKIFALTPKTPYSI